MQSGATYFRLTAVPTPVEFLYMGGNTWRYPVNSYIINNQVSLDFGFLPTLDEEFLALPWEHSRTGSRGADARRVPPECYSP